MIEEAQQGSGAQLRERLLRQVETAFRGIYATPAAKRQEIVTQTLEELRRSVDYDTAAGIVMLTLDNEQEGSQCSRS